ncbi:MAG: hypothetical protein ACREJ6_10855, partial [Candidatus Methylomirabilis sp.]
MKPVLRLLGLAASLALSCSLWTVPPSFADQTLTILHTSEHHGQTVPIEQRGQPKAGGMAGRATQPLGNAPLWTGIRFLAVDEIRNFCMRAQ